jgi:hypothetical protein
MSTAAGTGKFYDSHGIISHGIIVLIYHSAPCTTIAYQDFATLEILKLPGI